MIIDHRNNSGQYSSQDEDFTEEHYLSLLLLAKRNYVFVRYKEIPWGSNFILWRHDCDLSINRAFSLARIEHENEVVATYFVNPHSDFYNIYEKTQSELLQNIIGLGHDIGLHLDAAFYGGIKDSETLEKKSDQKSFN